MTRHLALPIRVGATGALASVVQDSPADIAQSLGLLVLTRPGERASVPGYGSQDPLFGGVDTGAVADAAAEWEDRATPSDVERVIAGVVQAATVRGTAPSTTGDDGTTG